MRIFSSAIYCLVALLGSVKAENDTPQIDSLFHAATGVAQAKSVENFSGTMLVSSSSAEAAKFTARGFTFINAGWDVAAYRHFCAALKLDESCLMAHVGVALSLASPQYHELAVQRKSAVLRLVELVGAKRDGEFIFPAKERGFALAVSYLFVGGSVAGSQAFDQLAVKYSRDHQINAIAAILKRDGYDALGKPKAGESTAIKLIEKLLAEHPACVVAQQYYLTLFVDAPVSVEYLKRNILPVARRLAAQADVGTWSHLLGVIEYRCGNLTEARASFRKAVQLLKAWRTESQIAVADAGALWKAYLFLAEVNFQLGDEKEAFKIGRMFSSLKVDEERLWAEGSQIVLWDGYTLSMRLNTRAVGGGAKALAASPNLKFLKKKQGKTAFVLYLDFYQNYLALRKAVALKDRKAATIFEKRVSKSFESIQKVNVLTRKTGEFTHSMRHSNYAELLYSELPALVSGDVLDKSIGYAQAAEVQSLPSQMFPPLCFYTMEEEWALSLMKREKYQRALDVVDGGLARRPSRLPLVKLRERLEKKLPSSAAK